MLGEVRGALLLGRRDALFYVWALESEKLVCHRRIKDRVSHAQPMIQSVFGPLQGLLGTGMAALRPVSQ